MWQSSEFDYANRRSEPVQRGARLGTSGDLADSIQLVFIDFLRWSGLAFREPRPTKK